MRCTPVSSAKTASAGRRGAGAFVLVQLGLFGLFGLLVGEARAELVGTYPHRNGTVHLMTDRCEGEPSAGQRARQTVGWPERQGCWGVDGAGNPVVTWSDGSELVLDGGKLKLSPGMAGVLKDRAEAPPARAPAEASAPTPRPRAVAPREAPQEPPAHSAARRDFARPAWCPDARLPHERLVCTDAELADRDLRLASLWRPYRRTLSDSGVAWHKSDYFKRLKACGADKACIVSQQEAQMRRYRQGLLAGG